MIRALLLNLALPSEPDFPSESGEAGESHQSGNRAEAANRADYLQSGKTYESGNACVMARRRKETGFKMCSPQPKAGFERKG